MTDDLKVPYIQREQAEVSVLGSALISPDCIGVVLAGTSEDEFDGSYRTIYNAIRAEFNGGGPVDVTTVGARLGPAYSDQLMRIMQQTPTAANVSAYLRVLREQTIIIRANEIGEQLMTETDPDACRALIDKASELLADRKRYERCTAEQLLTLFYNRMDQKPEYLDWGVERVNENVFAEAGDFIVIGGRPSAGKTAFALQCGSEMARKKRVGFFSLETGDCKFADRFVSHNAEISMKKIKRHAYSDADYKAVLDKSSDICAMKLDFIHASGMTVSEIRSYSLAQRYDVVFVDYLQIVESGLQRALATEQVRAISKDLHSFAQSTKTTVIALAQLRRPDTTADGEKAPTMADLKESGQIEQDADCILFIYKKEPNKANSPRIIKIGKNKEGTLGAFTMDFDGETQTFREPAKSSFKEMKDDDDELPLQFSIDDGRAGA